jgi:flagellar protein FliJ
MGTQHDRGLRAVARVREVRERDSLVGLRAATEEHLECVATVTELDALLARHTDLPSETDAGSWVATRAVTMHVAAATSQARHAADAADVVRLAAAEHWQRDRSRLRAVETLLERRAEARRAERDRRLARELDDLAGQRWLRARSAQVDAVPADGRSS